ncbi:activator of Hsp90 ATPase [Pelagophyceae sp. CCMP2097]|nr:activator of Hsp90 ATPase [Pelagophyceae sp. CCMP2097]
MPLDYSKFDNIVDSDDEKEKAKEVTTKKPDVPKPKCGNCGATPDKLVRCSICKKAGYCSAQCQRDDWKFHKRVCTAPVVEKDSNTTAVPKKGAGAAAATKKKNKVDEKDDSDDDKTPITWYKHRETKLPPSAQGPSKFDDAPESPADETEKRISASSVWNTAGTWEERNVLPWARKEFELMLPGLSCVRDDFTLTVKDVSAVTGDASVGTNRGKARHIFDLALELKIEVKVGDKVYTGKLTIEEFNHDALSTDADAVHVAWAFTDEKKCKASLLKAVSGGVGAGAMDFIAETDATPTTLSQHVLGALRDFLPKFNAL